MWASSSVPSASKSTISSSRLRNSGLNDCPHHRHHRVALLRRRRGSGRPGSASRGCEVRIRITLRKSTVRPWPSVSRPSSSTCSRMSKTSGCAFSTSSSSTTEYGPAAHRLGELAALVVADVAGRRADQPGHRVLLASTRSCRCGRWPARRRTGSPRAPWPARSCRRRSGRGTGTSRSAGPGRRCPRASVVRRPRRRATAAR